MLIRLFFTGDPALVSHHGAYHKRLDDNATSGQLHKLVCLSIRANMKLFCGKNIEDNLLLGLRKASAEEVRYISKLYSRKPRNVSNLRKRIASTLRRHIRHRRDNFLNIAIAHAQQCRHCQCHLNYIQYLKDMQSSSDKYNVSRTQFICGVRSVRANVIDRK